ncbi:hypothetical protein AB4Y42_33555 [Paraburkholderia sp. EG286B]|uniref:hypothetical protein n=1 Tax=Paraburkholderia sp. EG286B TaxID=3237011 RepID=UPI0034D1A653
MNETELDRVAIEDSFAVAQVALYLFAIHQVVFTLMTVTAGGSARHRSAGIDNAAPVGDYKCGRQRALLCGGLHAAGEVSESMHASAVAHCVGHIPAQHRRRCTSCSSSTQPLSSFDLRSFCRRRDLGMERARSDQKV